MKILKFLLPAAIAILLPAAAYSGVLHLGSVAAVTMDIHPFDTNTVVYQVTITANSADTLTDFAAYNGGNAADNTDIAAAKLWYKAGGGAFDPGTAVLVSQLNLSSKTWGISGLSFPVSNGGWLYVTVDIAPSPATNKTVKARVPAGSVKFTAGGSLPVLLLATNSTQTVTNPGYIIVSCSDFMPYYADAGQAGVYAARMTFWNSSASTASDITSVMMQSVNHAGGVTMNGALTRIIVKDAGTTYADYTAMGVSNTAAVPLTTALTVPAGGSPVNVDVYFDVSSSINTYDIGLRVPQASDIVNSAAYAVMPYTGFIFPFATSRAIITQPASSVNVSHVTLMPPNVTKGQQDVRPFVLRFTHPQSLTTYASCIIKGITITAMPSGGGTAASMFDDMDVSDGAAVFSGAPVLSASSGEAFLPFTQNLTITAGSYREVTVLADIKTTIPSTSFYISLSKSADILAIGGSSGGVLAASMVSSLTSTAASVQNQITNLGIHHTNYLPAYVAKSQAWVHAEDFVITHPDSGNTAYIEVKGITLNVEDSLGSGIVPSTVLSKVTVLDALNNTVLSYSSIPSSGTQVYLNFTVPQVLAPASNKTLKVYIDIPAVPSGTQLKLNLNAPSSVNAVDFNSGAAVAVAADSGDSFAMKTVHAQIVDAAVDVKVKHTDIMPASVNEGQPNTGAMLLYFVNTTAGIVSVEGIKFRFTDNAGTTIAANSVVSNVRIDMQNNTAVVYHDKPVSTTANTLDIVMDSPIVLNAVSANSMTVTARFTIANPALKNNFRVSVLNSASITAKDYNLGTAVPVNASGDTFPMQSSLTAIQARATDVLIYHSPGAAGPVNKGDVGIEVMDFAFRNPGNTATSAVTILGLTLTARNASGAVSANTVFARLAAYETGNPGNVYGELSTFGSSQYMYLRFTNPLVLGPAVSYGNLTITVAADISGAASQTQFLVRLDQAQMTGAVDSNQGNYVTPSAEAWDAFPMDSNLINMQAGTKLKVLHTDTMPSTASNGQQGIIPMTLRFANTTDKTASIKGLTLTVEDAAGLTLPPSARITAIRVVDGTGTTNISTASILPSGGKIYLTFSSDLYVVASSYAFATIYADLADNTYTSSFRLNLTAAGDIDWLPNTMTMEADSGDTFPDMRTGLCSVQLKPVQGQISHNDVIPTTVSTGQVDIFAEILNLYNPNVTGTADIMLTGITLTVEDDTNTAIDPTTALKRILIKDGSNVYAYFTSIPSAAGPFYVPFDSPIYIGVSETVSARLYIDIVDTLQAGVFRINIKINSDVRFCDANSCLTIPAAAMNGDSFPMVTSSVIIQEKITACEASHFDVIPPVVNRGQQGINLLRLDFKNPGGVSAANMAITRLAFYIQDASNAGLAAAQNALTKISVKDGSGTVYTVVNNVPDNSAFVSIGLTTPINVQPGATKQIFVEGDINPAAPASGFKITLDKNTDVIARDANSYEILNVTASGDSFPMRSSYTAIQNKTTSLNLSSGSLIPNTVNKAQSDVPALYLLFTNPNPAGYSAAEIRGITITVENNLGTGIAPNEVLSLIKATDGGSTVYGTQASIPPSGSMAYLPFTTPLVLAAGASAGVTVYADIVTATARANFMLDLSSQAHVNAAEKNSGDAITSVAGSYPMRTALSTIYSTPGIMVQNWNAAPVNATAGQAGLQSINFRFTNIGSFTEQVTGITITVKDAGGADKEALGLLSAVYYLDASLNTRAAKAVTVSGAQVYLDLSSWPVSIPYQQYAEGAVYFDVSASAPDTSFYLRAAAGSITGTVSVSADTAAGYSFPMDSGLVSVQRMAPSIEAAHVDLMPPTVSTGQAGVYPCMYTFANNNPAGYAPVVITAVTLTVLDSSGAPLAAGSAISRITLTDLTDVYIDTASIPMQPQVYLALPQPVTLTAGESRDIYLAVDIIGNTAAAADSFRIGISSSADIAAGDYNSGSVVAVNAAAGAAFPMESSAALIQKKAQALNAAATGAMPAFVSTDQAGVTAMNLVLADTGNTQTASIMITRINLYVLDGANNQINPANSIKVVRITSQDGLTVFGETAVFAGNKITVNLTAPIIVSAASPVTAAVKIDIAPSVINPAFKVSLESALDIYALDANSFELVPSITGAFPLVSGAAQIEYKVTGVDIKEFIPLLPAGVTRGQQRVPVFSFRIEDNLNTVTADAVFEYLMMVSRDSSDAEISMDSALSMLYLVDGDGTTIGSRAPSALGSSLSVFTSPACHIGPGSGIYVTVYADILPTAAAGSFKLFMNSEMYVSVKDENSGLAVTRTASPAMPWQSGTAGIYDAPATDLHVWHNSMMPTQVGRGQSKVMAMGLSMYNPGTAGTADVVLQGVTLTAYSGTGVTLTPDSVLSYIEFTDLTGTYFYGGVTPPAGQAVYIPAQAVISAAASNTATVYFKAKIAASAPETTFKLVIESAGFIGAHNDPAGYVTVTAVNADSFPMETGLTTVIISTNIVRVGHVDLMPVSAVKGQAGVTAMQIDIRNESSIDMLITGVTITVKAKDNSLLDCGSVMSAIRIVDADANTVVYGTGIMSPSGTAYFGISFPSPAFTEKSFKVAVDVSASAQEPFYVELDSNTDISTDQPSSIDQMAGHVFGGMQSSVLSIQQADLTESYHSFPNPFNPDGEMMKVEYYLPAASEVTIKILTLDGRPVRDLVDKTAKAAGLHYEDEWDGRNGAGGSVKTGVYLCVLEVKDTATGETKKLVKKIGVLR